MITSKLNTNIPYDENKNVDPNDINHVAYVYSGLLYKTKIEFILGKSNKKEDVTYYNIYLVKYKKIICKIGIHETKEDYSEHIDTDGNVIFKDTDYPIIFPLAKQIIENVYPSIQKSTLLDKPDFKKENDSSEDNSSEDNSSEDNTSNDDSSDDGSSDHDSGEDSQDKKEEDASSDISYKENYSTHSDDIKKPDDEKFIKREGEPWVVEILKDHSYLLEKIEKIPNDNGNSFFSVLQKALMSTEKYKSLTITNIREKLANEIDDEIFKNYIERKNLIFETLEKMNTNINKSKQSHKSLSTQARNSSDYNEKQELIIAAKKNITELQQNVDIKKKATQLYNELNIEAYKDINTLDELKDIVKNVDNKFYADKLIIGILERIFNVKFIILAEDDYNYNIETENEDNILICDTSDPEIKRQFDKYLEKNYKNGGNPFIPDYYIMTSYNDNHYDLIQKYKNSGAPRSLFKFDDLNNNIKDLIVNNCLQQCSGQFSYIPDFRNLVATKCAYNKDDYNDYENYKASMVKELTNVDKSDKSIKESSKSSSKSSENLFSEDFVIKIPNDGKPNSKPLKTYTNIDKITPKKELHPSMLMLYDIIKDKKRSWRYELSDKYILDDFKVDTKKYESVQQYLDTLYKSDINNYNNKYYKALEIKFSRKDLHDLLVSTQDAKLLIFKSTHASKQGIDAYQLMKLRKKLIEKK